MLSNKIISNIWKVSAVLLVIVVGAFIYFKGLKSNTLTNNNVNNPVSSGNNNDVNNEENITPDDEEKNDTSKNDTTDKTEDNNQTENSNQNQNNNQSETNNNTGKLEDDQNSTTNDDQEVTNDKDTPIKNEINNNKKTIVLEDRMQGANCAQAIEYFYEDSEYRYYFTCIKSNSMYVIVNGQEYKLVDALKNGVVTIKELENNGYKFLKKSKNLQTK